FAAFSDDVEDDVRAKRFLTAELKATVVVCWRLRELPGFASVCSPKSHGRICEGTTARLDLSLDPNAGPLLREPIRARRRHGAERNKHTKPDSLGHAHGSLLPEHGCSSQRAQPHIREQFACHLRLRWWLRLAISPDEEDMPSPSAQPNP